MFGNCKIYFAFTRRQPRILYRNGRTYRRVYWEALAGMLAVIAGQPLGALVQKYVTTKADVYNLRVTGISAKGFGPLKIHKVDTVAEE